MYDVVHGLMNSKVLKGAIKELKVKEFKPGNTAQSRPAHHRVSWPAVSDEWLNSHILCTKLWFYLLKLSPSNKIFDLPDCSNCIFMSHSKT